MLKFMEKLAELKRAKLLALSLLLIAAVGSTPLPKELWRRLEGRLSAHPIPLGAMETCLVAAGMVLSIAFLVDASYNPFLYFRF